MSSETLVEFREFGSLLHHQHLSTFIGMARAAFHSITAEKATKAKNTVSTGSIKFWLDGFNARLL